MNVLSLFDGMSCGQIALNRAGVRYDNYFASEIDKWAIQVTQKNFPNTIQLGDVTKILGSDLPKIDLIMGGSPCQSFSNAGLRTGFDGKSGLFWEFIRILHETNPTYFLLENVKMKREWEKIITDEMGIEPIEICSSLFSAQQRKRLYWTNIPVLKDFPSSDEVIADILGLDVIEKKLDRIITKNVEFTVRVRKHYVDKTKLCEFLRSHKNKSIQEISVYCDAPKTMVEHWFRCDGSFSIPGAEYWHKLKEILEIEDISWDRHIMEFEVKNNSFDMAKRIYHIDGKHPTLTTLTGGGQRKTITDGSDLFYLTPEHCERLQTVPIGYTEGVSDRQRFRMLGNGWTVDVIAHIFRGLSNSLQLD